MTSAYHAHIFGPLEPPTPDFIAIYGLYEPGGGPLRYIGKTRTPLRRFRFHLYESKLNGDRSHRGNWLRGLLRGGLLPEMRILDWVDPDHWVDAECFYIAHAKSIGCALVNIALGGSGGAVPGGKRGPETRAKMSAWQVGKVKSPETRERIRVALTGRKVGRYSEQHAQAISAGLKGKPKTSEHTQHLIETRRRLFAEDRAARGIPADGWNPSGRCMCGCGQTTPLAAKTALSQKAIQGKHLRCVPLHRVRTKTPKPPRRQPLPRTGDGLCRCGCGEKAPLAPKKISRLGYEKGQPVDYCAGHRQRVDRLSTFPPLLKS